MGADQKGQSFLDLLLHLSPSDINRLANQTPFGRRRLLTGTATVVSAGLGVYALSKIAGSSNEITLTASELNSKVDKFFTDNNGQYKDFDGAYGYQCEDLANLYSIAVVGGKQFTGLHAFEIFGQQPERYTMVKFDPNKIPPRGSLVVWKGEVNGGDGHVGIATGEGDVSKVVEGHTQPGWINVFSQSSNPKHPPEVDKYYHNDEIIGWMVPKTKDEQTQTGGSSGTPAPHTTFLNTGETLRPGDVSDYESSNLPYGLNYPKELTPILAANETTLIEENFQRNLNPNNGSLFVSRYDLSIAQHIDLQVKPNMSLDEYVAYLMKGFGKSGFREGQQTFGNGVNAEIVGYDDPGTIIGYPIRQRGYVWLENGNAWDFGYFGYTTHAYTINGSDPLINPYGHMENIFNQVKDTFVLKT